MRAIAHGGVGVVDPQCLVGRRFRLTDHYEVGREKIREFARAVHNTHAAHYREDVAREFGHAGLVAPMTFTAILGGIAQRVVFAEFLPGYDLSQVLHTDQRIRLHRPIVAGDRLTSSIMLAEFRRRHGQDSFLFETVITDGAGDAVQTNWTHAVARADAVVDPEIADIAEMVLMSDVAPPAFSGIHAMAVDEVPPRIGTRSRVGVQPRQRRRFAAVTAGDSVPTRHLDLTRGDLVNYAGVAGDPNPIHWSDSVAGLAGLDGIVAHGMLTMGLSAGYLTSWAGDPSALREYSVRFTSPVLLDPHRARIDIAGRVKELDPTEHTATVALTATSAGKRIFGRATATVALA